MLSKRKAMSTFSQGVHDLEDGQNALVFLGTKKGEPVFEDIMERLFLV